MSPSLQPLEGDTTYGSGRACCLIPHQAFDEWIPDYYIGDDLLKRVWLIRCGVISPVPSQ